MTNEDLRKDPLLDQAPMVDGYRVLDPVLVVEKIGGGGMGSVYRGQHLNLDIEVAVKCLDGTLAARDGEFIARFQREAKVAASINHQNLIHVYDVAQNHGIHYLVMELVSGESISRRVRRKGPLPEAEALRIFRDAARGLAAAHKKGIVHRDIKPDNILISAEGEVKVADLGLAKAFDGAHEQMTSTNVTLGTPQYMPPEQWEDVRLVGPATDVHALAHTLYFMLTGKEAWSGKSVIELAKKISFEEFPDPGKLRADISDATRALIKECTAREPKARPADAAAVAAFVDRNFTLPDVPAMDPSDDALSERPTNFLPSAATIEKARTALSRSGIEKKTVAMASRPQANPAIAATVLDRPKSAVLPPRAIVSRAQKKSSGARIAIAAALVVIAIGAGVLHRMKATDEPKASVAHVEEPVAQPSISEAADDHASSSPESRATKATEATITENPIPPAKDETENAKPTPIAHADAAPETAAPAAPELPSEIHSNRDDVTYRLVRDAEGQAFWIAEIETTIGAYRAFAATVPDEPEQKTEERPERPRSEDEREPPAGEEPPPRPEDDPRGGPPPFGRPRPPRNGPPPRRDGPGPEARRPLREAIERRAEGAAPRARVNPLLGREHREMLQRMSANEPVINLPMPAIRAYAQWIQDGLHDQGKNGLVRLPTTDEWRLAAGRARNANAKVPATAAFPDGRAVPDANLKGGANWNGRALHAVRSYAADPSGLFDMLGNAAEVCDDGLERGLFLIGGSFWTTARADFDLDHPRAYRPPEPFSSAAGFRLVFIAND